MRTVHHGALQLTGQVSGFSLKVHLLLHTHHGVRAAAAAGVSTAPGSRRSSHINTGQDHHEAALTKGPHAPCPAVTHARDSGRGTTPECSDHDSGLCPRRCPRCLHSGEVEPPEGRQGGVPWRTRALRAGGADILDSRWKEWMRSISIMLAGGGSPDAVTPPGPACSAPPPARPGPPR